MKQIESVVSNNYPHNLYPFFWQKGQSEEVITEYIEKMYEQGIHDFCVESRPHPEFLEEGWWKLMDHMIAEAKKRGMRIWILDDAQFPTGYANGKVPAELKKKYLNYHRYDIAGTGSECLINVSCPAGIRGKFDPRHAGDHIIAAVLAENDISSMRSFREEELTDVTDNISDGLLKLNLDKKDYSIFVIYETACGEEKTTEDYLDPMNPEATQILLNEVYQKHYDHYAEEFGKTITAFFSDEPRFGNTGKRTDLIGRTDTPLPWNHLAAECFFNEKGLSRTDLVFLFQGVSRHASNVRFDYMDTVSSLYSENFARVIGNWCHEHNVMYVGHVIEDDNVHARLGYGCGHYFRAMAGEDVAGIDVIGGQIVPGMDYPHDAFSTGGSDGEFYHYALARMAASCAKLDPKKQGRAMCEAFGAYGWTEGLQMMKWITDHLVSHGVNMLVPHAFDPAEFPDWDCPPHFYAHGMNPQYPYFHVWSEYADRLCALFSGGTKQAKIGVLYHAFAEWGGNTMYFQKVCKVLQQKQLDSDVIGEDYLAEAKSVQNGFMINGNEYNVLIVPECEFLPEAVVKTIEKISENTRVIFVNRRPEDVSFGEVFTLDELPAVNENLRTVHITGEYPHLNVYEYVNRDGKIWMFFNEDINSSTETEITVESGKRIMAYDAFENALYDIDQTSENGKTSFRLTLKPYESLVVMEGNTSDRKPQAGEYVAAGQLKKTERKAYNSKDFEETDIETVKNDCTFSGTVRYTFEADLTEKDVMVSTPDCGEIVQLTVNGTDCGTKICPDYTFDISRAVTDGTNEIVITAVNTLVHHELDLFSMYIQIENTYPKPVLNIYRKK